MSLRNAISLAMVTAGAVGLLVSGGKPVTLHSGFITIPTGPDTSTHDFYLSVPAGTLVLLIVFGLVMLFWPRGRKPDA